MRSPSAPTPPPPPPRVIESLAAADEELKKLTGKGFAEGGGASEGRKRSGVLSILPTRPDRVGQLRDFIQKQMGKLDESRRTAGQGRRANIKAGKKLNIPAAREEETLL